MQDTESVRRRRVRCPPVWRAARLSLRAMQPPAVTRHRRPFLAPFWVMWLLFFAVVAVAFMAYRVGHHDYGGARSPCRERARHHRQSTADGGRRARAERLAQMFGGVRGAGRIEGIYVTDTRRTQQTAMPLATRLGLNAVIMPAADVKGMAARVLHDHRGGTRADRRPQQHPAGDRARS